MMSEPKGWRRVTRKVTFWLAVSILVWAVCVVLAFALYEPRPTEEYRRTDTRLVTYEAQPLRCEAPVPVSEPGTALEESRPATYAEAVAIAKTVWGEARGCSVTEQAAVVWCVLNRVDCAERFYPDDILGVVSQPNQFTGYSENHPVELHLLELVWDVLERWQAEKDGTENVGRVLPQEYLWFHGDGKTNHFRDAYKGKYNTWDWSLDSPYEEEL